MNLTFGFLPAPGLEPTVRIDKNKAGWENSKHGLETFLDLVAGGNTGRMDVVNTRANLIRVAVLLERMQELHIALGGLDGDDISVKTLDGGEDVVEIGIAEVGVSLEGIRHTRGGELKRINSPLEVTVPVHATQGKLIFFLVKSLK